MPQNKKKLVIISAGYPYGLKETFLHNEVMYLSNYFDIEIFPILKKYGDGINPNLPSAVTYNKPILNTSHIKRSIKGLFNTAPVLPYLKDFKAVLKSRGFFKWNITQWFLSLLTFRVFYTSLQWKKIKASGADIIYFYWGTIPVDLLRDVNMKLFVRIHGSEVDLERSHHYIPVLNYRVANKNNAHYLPISMQAAANLLTIKNVCYTVNRLGVYDYKIGPQPDSNNIIRIVSCSNLIPLKRVHLIVEALQTIRDINIEWVHFGDGPSMQEIQKASKRLHNNIKVQMAGRLANNRIIEFYTLNYVDLFINVSIVEGIPVSIMEALSFGIPCFATNVGGTKEIINNENGCFVSKDFAVDELAGFIRNIRNENIKQLRIKARKTFETMCNAEKNYQQLVDIFNGEN